MYGAGYLPTPVSDPQVLAQVAHARLERSERMCEHGRPYIPDAMGHPQSTCYACPADYSQFSLFHAIHLPQFLPTPDSHLARSRAETSAFTSPQICLPRADRPDHRPHPYANSLYYSYSPYLDPTNGARRKAATKETTHPLKVWLTDHRKNPYPTKAEKILLAIMTKMSLTQVSTWFANARRRLKKENKMNYENNSDANSGGGNSPAAAEDNSASNGETPHASGSEKTHNSEDEDIEVSDISDGEAGRGKVDDAKDNDEIDESVSPDLRAAYTQMMLNREAEKEEDNADGVIIKPRPSPSGSKSPMSIVVPSGIQRPRGEGSNDSGTSRGKIWSISNILESGPKPPASSPPTHPPPAEAFFHGLQYPVNMSGTWQYPSPLTVGHQPHPLRLTPFPSASTATTATVSVLSSASCSPVKCQVTSPPTTDEAVAQQRASHSPPDSVIGPAQSPQRQEEEGETEALNLKTEPHSDASQQTRL